MEANKKRSRKVNPLVSIEQQEEVHEEYKTDSDMDEETEEMIIKPRKTSSKKEIPPKPKRMKAAVFDDMSEHRSVENDEKTDTEQKDIESIYEKEFEEKQNKQKEAISNNLIASQLYWISKSTKSEAFRIIFKDFLPYLQIGSFEYDRITTTFRPSRSSPWSNPNSQFKSVAEIPIGDSLIFDLFKGKFEKDFTSALKEAQEKKTEYESKLIAQQQRYQQRFGAQKFNFNSYT